MANPATNWRNNLKNAEWVDVLDTDGRWCLAEVTESRPGHRMITIHYLGWPIKWVETLARDSDRLAPPLSKTGHLDGQTGEVEGRARVEFVRTITVGMQIDAFDEAAKVWRLATVEGIAPERERTSFTVRYVTTGVVETIHTKKDYLIKAFTGNLREGSKEAAKMAAAAGGEAPKEGAPKPKTEVKKPPPKGLGHNLKQWGFADVRDGDLWRIAEVLEVKDDQLYFRFLGWTEPRWNLWLHRDSPLIVTPPFTHVKGDTGYKAVSKNYDCMHDCMWKRAMVIGLGRAGLPHSQIEGIGHLLQVCCSLQDKLQFNSMLPGLDFKKWVQALDVALTAKRAFHNQTPPKPVPAPTPAPVAAAGAAPTEEKKEEAPAPVAEVVYTFHPALTFAIDTITHIVRGLKEACVDADNRQDEVVVQKQEETYMLQVKKDFDMVEVPGDGNCLFAATARGDRIATTLRDAKDPVDAKGLASLVAQAKGTKKDDSLTASRTYRFRAVQMLNERASFHGAVKGEVAHAITAYGDPKGRMNQTNQLIHSEMKRAFPANPLEGAHTPTALQVYSQVMGQDGIFGTDLEAEALCEELKTPVWVFYREAGMGDYNGHPTRVFGARFSGYPICLAFYRANKHYNLLVPKRPVVWPGLAPGVGGGFSFQEQAPEGKAAEPSDAAAAGAAAGGAGAAAGGGGAAAPGAAGGGDASATPPHPEPASGPAA